MGGRNKLVLLLGIIVVMILEGSKGGWAWNWIVAGVVAGSNSSYPPCPSYCVNVLGGIVARGVPVGLWWCQGSTYLNEQWTLSLSPLNQSIAQVQVQDYDGLVYCLDAPLAVVPDNSANTTTTTNNNGSRPVLVSSCDPASSTQRWIFQIASNRILNAGVGSEEFLYASISENKTYYMYVGSHTNDSADWFTFTLFDSSAFISTEYKPPLPTSRTAQHSNFIQNGDLQTTTNYAKLAVPLQPMAQPASYLAAGDQFILCHWLIVSNTRINKCSNMTTISDCKAPPSCTAAAANPDRDILFLNWMPYVPPPEHGSILQTVRVSASHTTYVFLFDLVVTSSLQQSLSVSISPSSLPPSGLLFSSSASQTFVFTFLAYSDLLNVSFVSTDSTPCGPSISNIQMYLSPTSTNISTKSITILGIGIAALALGISMLAISLYYYCYYYTSRKKQQLGVASGDDLGLALLGITKFHFEQLREYTEDFSTVLGEGGFGTVYLGSTKDGTMIAVKRANRTGMGAVAFLPELEILGRVHHRYIVKFLGYCDEEGELMLVFEYVPNKSLYDWLHGGDIGRGGGVVQLNMNWNARMRIAYQVAYALEYLHHGANPPILHRDVKSANILLTWNMSARLADYGISREGRLDATRWQTTMTAAVRGSRGYMDPYYLQTNTLSDKIDAYSFGVLLFELISGRKAITDSPNGEKELLVSRVKRVLGARKRIEDVLDRELLVDEATNMEELAMALEVAESCVETEPHHRPSMIEVVQKLRVFQHLQVNEVENAGVASKAAPSDSHDESTSLVSDSHDESTSLVTGR